MQDWSEVGKHIDSENLLQARTKAQAREHSREVLQRMSTLNDG
ncbi:MAG: BrxA family protein [Acidimicrobiia bacterium]